MSNAEQLKVTLVKSPIGYTESQKKTLQCLGLRKMNSSRVVKATPEVRGMISKVAHLVAVTPVVE